MSLAEFNDAAVATLEGYRSTLADAIHNGSPTYMFMKEQGVVDSGPTEGPSFVRPILARDTSEPQWWRYADKQTFTPSDTAEAARFRYFNVRHNVGVTAEELKENEGLSKRLDLLGLKVRAAELTLRDRYNKAWIWNRSTYVNQYGAVSTNLPDGIPAILGLSTGGSTSRSYGELARTTGNATWFRAQAASAGAVAGTLSTSLRSLWLNCSRDGFTPGLILCNQPAYVVIGRVLEQRVQLTVDVTGGKQPMLNGGWEGLAYNGAQVRWDPSILGLHGGGVSSDGVVWYLNKDFWGLREDAEWNWLMFPFTEVKGSDEQFVHKTTIVHRCTMYHDNPRFCGVLHNISTNQT